MLVLVTYKFIYHCYGKSVFIWYKARAIVLLLFSGLTRAFELIIDNSPAFFYAPSASLLPSASADGLKDLEAKPLPLWVFNPFH